MEKLKILHVTDKKGWAYHWICVEQARYSKHEIIIKECDKVSEGDVKSADVVYIHSVDISEKAQVTIPLWCRRYQVKVIGAMSGEIDKRYNEVDLVATISPQLYKWAEKHYKCPVAYVNECVDTEYFTPAKKDKSAKDKFVVGYCGRLSPVKRPYIMEALNYPVTKMSDHGKQFFTEDASLDKVRDFYSSIDVKILTSSSECKSRALLEAMAMGLPCISTDVGTARMMLAPEWVIPANPDSNVVTNMNSLLSLLEKYPQVRKDNGKRNREWVVKHFSWETQTAKWDALYEALVAEDFKAIKEISDGWIEPFKGLFDSAEPFQPREDLKPRNPVSVLNRGVSREPVVSKTPSAPSDERVIDFIRELTKSGVFYWLRNQTCLSAIKGSLTANNNALYLGVKFPKNVSVVEALAKSYGFNAVVEVNDGQRTKSHGLGNLIVNVPMPVVTYLEHQFGKGCVDDYK